MPRPSETTEKQIARMKSLRKKGLTYKQIAEKLGIPVARVKYWTMPGRRKSMNKSGLRYYYNSKWERDDE